MIGCYLGIETVRQHVAPLPVLLQKLELWVPVTPAREACIIAKLRLRNPESIIPCRLEACWNSECEWCHLACNFLAEFNMLV